MGEYAMTVGDDIDDANAQTSLPACATHGITGLIFMNYLSSSNIIMNINDV